MTGSVFGGALLPGAMVSFIEAFGVGDGTAGSPSLQPLEDVALEVESRVVTDASGEFSIELLSGRYFVFVTPPV